MILKDEGRGFECMCEVPDSVEKVIYEFPEEKSRDYLIDYLTESNKNNPNER